MHTTDLMDPVTYLTFSLGEELFAIRVCIVREILELSHITRVPCSPLHMRGVVDVRGTATAVMDLRTRLGLPRENDSASTRIMVMQLELDHEDVVLGGLADSVHEVITLAPSQISPPPRVGMRWRAEMLEGIGRHGDRYVILLDMARILSSTESALLDPGHPVSQSVT